MQPDVAIALIRAGVDPDTSNQHWADLGAGTGTFTRALSSLTGPGSTIYAVDRQAHALQTATLDQATVIFLQNDFMEDELMLDPLHGVLMANSLHFVHDKVSMLKKVKRMLRAEGRLILVEYDMTRGNRWVPYPIAFADLGALAEKSGFGSVQKLAEQPSQYQRGNLYSALLRYP